ncbi:hypothetical protein GJR96_02755 [Haloferax sp. MBLA0076]|uniref:Uncharacterized protein n=1 Tax=Haloferax litoreum TaxID=2666140 RepID=A0A6A8GCT2_9EURY|nr:MULTISPECIES: hypothetical protein [Haloferax]KAB1192418.1 hypothetical protein Hfx1148_02740 [Haloferax sp. CBA1148]MRX20885.1 hypothetical protein [Haloferax litoreum]
MFGIENTSRRKFLAVAVALGSMTGCLGSTSERPGAVDSSDLSVSSRGSAKLTAKNVQNDNNNGLKISTEDSVADGKVVGEIPASVPEATRSSVYINADVDQLDDDAEIEIRFCSPNSSYRAIFVGNEYKGKESGVLATETGSGYVLREQIKKLPTAESKEQTQINDLDRVQFVVRDGDFTGTIWALWFIFEDRTVALL